MIDLPKATVYEASSIDGLSITLQLQRYQSVDLVWNSRLQTWMTWGFVEKNCPNGWPD